jgi:hypothetical protein
MGNELIRRVQILPDGTRIILYPDGRREIEEYINSPSLRRTGHWTATSACHVRSWMNLIRWCQCTRRPTRIRHQCTFNMNRREWWIDRGAGRLGTVTWRPRRLRWSPSPFSQRS